MPVLGPNIALGAHARGKGGGVRYDQMALDLFARYMAEPSSLRKRLLNDFIVAGRDQGWLAKHDAFWFQAVGLDDPGYTTAYDAHAARRNLVADQYNITAVGSPVHIADRGYSGNGTSSYQNTNFNAATATAPKYTLNSAHASFTVRTVRAAQNSLQMGASGGSGAFAPSLTSRYTGDTQIQRVNQATSNPLQLANSQNEGRYLATRTGPSAQASYKNGGLLIANNTASSGVIDGNVYIGCINGSGTASFFTSDQFAQASIGAGLGAAEIAARDAAIVAYLTAVGAL